MAKGKWIVLIAALALIAIFAYQSVAPSYPDILTAKPDFGTANSPVKIIEFSDLQCPACGNAHPMVKQIIENYGDEVSFKYFHFPLRSIHPFAQKAAEAAECANDQGKMEEFINIAFANQHALTRDNLKQYAKTIGLDGSFDACLDSGAKKTLIDADFRAGVSRSVDSTPTFYINDVKVVDRSYDAISAQLDALLAQQ
jgi:protein-disulfide isomerase